MNDKFENKNELNDFEIEKLFSKHLNNQSQIGKVKMEFNNKNVRQNKKEIAEMQKLNLIKTHQHFAEDYMDDLIDEDEEEQFHFNESEKSKSNSKGYFKSVIDETKNNASIYCSYLDHFDKMWMSNSKFK